MNRGRLYFCAFMIFSKSFGYALRGLLYVALVHPGKDKVQLDEIAEKLSVPRHFLGKVMKNLVKAGILDSLKGPYGGFSLNQHSLQTTLLRLVEATGEMEEFSSCSLRLRKCNAKNPCPLHLQVAALREEWHQLLASTRVEDLLKKDKPDFIGGISIL